MAVRIFKKITEIPPQDWNSVFPDVLEGYNFFKAVEESQFPSSIRKCNA